MLDLAVGWKPEGNEMRGRWRVGIAGQEERRENRRSGRMWFRKMESEGREGLIRGREGAVGRG